MAFVAVYLMLVALAVEEC